MVLLCSLELIILLPQHPLPPPSAGTMGVHHCAHLPVTFFNLKESKNIITFIEIFSSTMFSWRKDHIFFFFFKSSNPVGLAQ